MQVVLEKSFTVPTPPEAAWNVLSDIDVVASCMPGAHITEQISETHYRGQVKIKLGPAKVAFKGDIEVKTLDAEQRQLTLFGKGGDSKGTNASMDLNARIVPSAHGHCELIGTSTVNMNGRLVSLGSRLVNQISEQILNQFGHNFTEKATAISSPIASDMASNSASNLANESLSVAASTTAPKTAEAPSLNAMVLLWSTLTGMVRKMFSKQRA